MFEAAGLLGPPAQVGLKRNFSILNSTTAMKYKGSATTLCYQFEVVNYRKNGHFNVLL